MGGDLSRDVEKGDGSFPGVATSGGEVTRTEKISKEDEMGGVGEKGLVNGAAASSTTSTTATRAEKNSEEVEPEEAN